jgi:hypothetical protein
MRVSYLKRTRHIFASRCCNTKGTTQRCRELHLSCSCCPPPTHASFLFLLPSITQHALLSCWTYSYYCRFRENPKLVDQILVEGPLVTFLTSPVGILATRRHQPYQCIPSAIFSAGRNSNARRGNLFPKTELCLAFLVELQAWYE